MIDRRIVLLIAFLNFLVVSICLTIIIRDKFQEHDYQSEISSIKVSRDSLLRVNSLLEEKGKVMEQRAIELQGQIDLSTETIQTLKTKRNEKINQLDTMYVDGLVRFFTEFQTSDSNKQQ